MCSSLSLVGHILKSAIAVAFTTLVSSKRHSKAVHNASTRTFLSVAKMPLPHVNVEWAICIAESLKCFDCCVYAQGYFCHNGSIPGNSDRRNPDKNLWNILFQIFDMFLWMSGFQNPLIHTDFDMFVDE